MVAPDALKELDKYFRENYSDEIKVFIEAIDTIEAKMNEKGQLVGLQSMPPDDSDKQFAAIAWHGDNTDLEKYGRRFLISAVARLDTVVETGNDKRLTKADYELFKRTSAKLGGWLYFEVNRLRRQNTDLELLVRKEQANNKILSEGVAALQEKLENVSVESTVDPMLNWGHKEWAAHDARIARQERLEQATTPDPPVTKSNSHSQAPLLEKGT